MNVVYLVKEWILDSTVTSEDSVVQRTKIVSSYMNSAGRVSLTADIYSGYEYLLSAVGVVRYETEIACDLPRQ